MEAWLVFNEVVPYWAYPLMLVGFALLVYFGLHRPLLNTGLASPLTARSGRMEVKTGNAKNLAWSHRMGLWQYGYVEVPVRLFQLESQTMIWDGGGWDGANMEISENDRIAVVGLTSGGIFDVLAYKNLTEGIPCRINFPVQQVLILGFLVAIAIVIFVLLVGLPTIWGWRIIEIWAVWLLFMYARNYRIRRLLRSIS
jgi:hypothetical protein